MIEPKQLCSAYSPLSDSEQAAAALTAQLGNMSPTIVVFFATVEHDGALIGDALRRRFPQAQVAGCSRTESSASTALVPVAWSRWHWGKRSSAKRLPHWQSSIKALRQALQAAAAALGEELGQPLRALDPQKWVGLGFLEGATGREEQINEALGNVAPLLPFVGGSAGDRIRFERTWVYAKGQLSHNACALLVLQPARPFAIMKTCHFVATPVQTTVTKCDPDQRLIHELDGQPAVERYAELVGVPADKLEFLHYLSNPLGLMIDGEPWLRSVVRAKGTSLFFACSVLEGMTLNVMRPKDILEDAATAFERATAPLGITPRAAILFNCAYRMIEVQLKGISEDYHRALSQVPHIGCQSNGESYLGHINQTLTGLVLS
jgi:hypothetical protein